MEQESKVSICEQLGVIMRFTFVPISEAKKHKMFQWLEEDTLTLCYEVEVYKGRYNLVTQTKYASGSDVPSWVRPKYYGKDIWRSARKRVEETVCELGRCPKQPKNEAKFFSELREVIPPNLGWSGLNTKGNVPVPIFPSPDDVLGCLVSDAQCAYNARNFDEFCRDLGYDNDSIKALETYNACKDTLIALMRHFDFEQLCELFQDY